jgi:predicted  nucleic acid-binding Zn-ribbon protein
MDVEAKKRRVLEEIPTSSETAPADISHVSDSMPSQAPPSTIPEHPMLEPAPKHPMIESTSENQTSESTPNGAEPSQVTDDSAEPDVAMELDDDNETESEPDPELAYVFARPVAPILDAEDQPLEELSHAELLAMLKERNEELKNWMASQARLQTRFEELQQVLRDRKSEIKAHERTANNAVARRDRALADVEKLQAQKAALNSQIQDTLQLLKAGNPEMSALVAENKELKTQLEAAKNKIAAAEKEAGFVREQYQNASKAVLDVRRECEELQRENTVLKRKADERVVTLRQMANEDAIKVRDQQIEELKISIREKDERCARLAVREGTYGLKRGSVPRRIGSPAQSRGSSPSVAGRRPG